MTDSRSFVVTSAPPTPNGNLHLGHLSGPFLGADVMARFLTQQGHDVRHVGYSDEYSCYVPRLAEKLERSTVATAHAVGDQIEKTLALADMTQDHFTRPLQEIVHTEVVQRFFLEMWEKGILEVKELSAFHCEDCDQLLYEVEVRGNCQFCAAASDGIYCENCGRPQDTTGLTDPHCTRCGSVPVVRTLRRIVMPMERQRAALIDYYNKAQLTAPWRPRVRAYLDTLLSHPLPDTPISRKADYGIPVPLPGWEGHILDTWFSGIFGYLAATVALTQAEGNPGLGERLWRDPDTELIHFIGFDGNFSHAALWPALLLAHGGLTLPSQVITNEFYRLEGAKFSTSRGHAIWGSEFLRYIPSDAMRFHLCLTGPEQEQTNFAMEEFRETLGALACWQEWANEVLVRADEAFGGEVPAIASDPVFAEVITDLPGQVADALAPGGFSPMRAAQAVFTAVDRGVKEAVALDGLHRSGEDAYLLALAAHLDLLATVAAVAAPLTPAWSNHLLARLGIAPADQLTGRLPWPLPGQPLRTPGARLGGAPEVFFHAR